MRLPIRNHGSTIQTIFIEPLCEQYDVPVGGSALVILEDGRPHTIDVHPENWLSIWNESSKDAQVEIFEGHAF